MWIDRHAQAAKSSSSLQHPLSGVGVCFRPQMIPEVRFCQSEENWRFWWSVGPAPSERLLFVGFSSFRGLNKGTWLIDTCDLSCVWECLTNPVTLARVNMMSDELEVFFVDPGNRNSLLSQTGFVPRFSKSGLVSWISDIYCAFQNIYGGLVAIKQDLKNDIWL